MNKPTSTPAWLGGRAIFVDGKQVAEVIQAGCLHIRTLRENGTVGVAFSTDHRPDIRPWLDKNIPEWYIKSGFPGDTPEE